jgi:hypothetical protein
MEQFVVLGHQLDLSLRHTLSVQQTEVYEVGVCLHVQNQGATDFQTQIIEVSAAGAN